MHFSVLFLAIITLSLASGQWSIEGVEKNLMRPKSRLNSDSSLGSFVKHFEKIKVHILAPSLLISDGRKGMFYLEALGKQFKVAYTRKPDNGGVFASNAKLTVFGDQGKHQDIALDEILRDYIEGHLINDPDSYVYGDLSDGIFDGIIVTSEETYFVEPASKYFRGHKDSDFNVVAYRESDVSMCPSHSKTKKKWTCNLESEPVSMMTTEKNEMTEDKSRSRYGKVCRTRIIIDHTFFLGVARGIERNAINEVNLHMRAADYIFRNTDLDGDDQPDGIGLQVSSVHLMTSNNVKYPLQGEFSNPDDFLRQVAEYDLDDVCAGFVFTHRNMGGVLGASYLGVTERGVAGGICTKRNRYKDFDYKLLNLNSGFASFKFSDSNEIVPRARSIVTVAHEFGHLFGSPHDDVDDDEGCNPSRPTDKYLMATKRAVNAPITERNKEFSTCSRKHIVSFLTAKGNCLVD